MSIVVSAEGDWLVRVAGPAGASRRLVCFPNAGGSATAFRPWSAHLPADTELIAIQFPGRQKRIREPPIRDLRAAVEALLPVLAGIGGPDAVFFGDCTGGLVAYEAIRAGAAAGLVAPGHLIVSCCRAPDRQPRHPPLHPLDEAALVAEMRRLAFAPQWLLDDPQTLRSFLPLLRCDFELAETYVHRPGPPLAVPITAVAGIDDGITPQEDVMAWAGHTSADFRFLAVEGSHDLALTRPASIWPVLAECAGGGHDA